LTRLETAVPTKREKALEKRKQHILNAALMCFLENGYHQTGVRDIAKRADVSLGNLYNHFPGKHDILVEIARLERGELDPFLKMLAKTSDPGKLFEKFARAYAKYLMDPETVVLTLEISIEAIRKPDIAEMFLANHQLLVDALVGLLERGMETGDFRDLPDASATAHCVLELIEGAAYRSMLTEVTMRRMMPGVMDFLWAAVRK